MLGEWRKNRSANGKSLLTDADATAGLLARSTRTASTKPIILMVYRDSN